MAAWNDMTLILGGVALLGAAATWSAYLAARRALRAKVLAGATIAETATGPVEYATAGTGMPLLSSHGAGGGYDQGLMIASALVGDRYQVIAPSRYGYLRTPVPRDASASAQADAHAALLDVLRADRAIVVGVSAGAPSAVQLALRYPERVAALILLSPLGYAPGGQAPLPGGQTILKLTSNGADFAYWAMLHLRPSALIRFFGVPPELLNGAGVGDHRWVFQLLHSALPLSPRVAGVANDLAIRLSQQNASWPLERIAAPTLILASSDDLFHTQPAAEYIASHIPGARLVVYPTGGHLFIGHLAEVRDTVAAFLKQVPTRP